MEDPSVDVGVMTRSQILNELKMTSSNQTTDRLKAQLVRNLTLNHPIKNFLTNLQTSEVRTWRGQRTSCPEWIEALTTNFYVEIDFPSKVDSNGYYSDILFPFFHSFYYLSSSWTVFSRDCMFHYVSPLVLRSLGQKRGRYEILPLPYCPCLPAPDW